jgi:hypothetical protein
MLVNCYDGNAGVSLSEEAWTKDNEAYNAEGRFCSWALSGFEENFSEELVTQESVMDSNAMKRTSEVQCGIVLPKCK